MHSSCCPFLHATFSRAEDANAIPLDGKVIQVKTPDVDEHRDGGIGLDDLHVYLNPETRERVLLDRDSETEKEREWGPPEGKVMDVKLERTCVSYFPLSPHTIAHDPILSLLYLSQLREVRHQCSVRR